MRPREQKALLYKFLMAVAKSPNTASNKGHSSTGQAASGGNQVAQG